MYTEMWLRNRIGLLMVLFMVAALLAPGVAQAAEETAFDLRFSGVIDSVDFENQVGTITVAGYVLVVDENTTFHLTTGVLTPQFWADVSADRQEDQSLLATRIVVSPPEVRLKGPILDRPADGIGYWNIAGQAILVTEDTRISQRGGPMNVADWVEVFALEESGNTLVAQRMRGIETQQTITVYGAIQDFDPGSWMISSMTVAVDAATLICGDPQLGLLSHAQASLQDDDTLLALSLKPVWTEPTALRPEVSFNGSIEQLPDGTDLTGLWVVSGQNVLVTNSTIINEEKGPVTLLAPVHVIGWQEIDHIVAYRITVLDCVGQCGSLFRFRGPIQDMPPHGFWGLWTIGGYQVQVNQRTRLEGARYAQLGAPAEVGAVRRQNGELVATWLRIRPVSAPVEISQPPAKRPQLSK